MATTATAVSVNQIVDMIKMDFLYEFGKQIIDQIGAELLPDTPENEQANKYLTGFAAAATLDKLGIPTDAFDHLFKNKAIEALEDMMLSDLIDLNKEAAKEAMINGDIDEMMVRLTNVRTLTENLES